MSDPSRQYQTFQHHKGGIYVKMCEALHTETGEHLTVYICAVSGMVFCRPTTMFNEVIKEDGYSGPRFIPLPSATTKAQRKSLTYDPANA